MSAFSEYLFVHSVKHLILLLGLVFLSLPGMAHRCPHCDLDMQRFTSASDSDSDSDSDIAEFYCPECMANIPESIQQREDRLSQNCQCRGACNCAVLNEGFISISEIRRSLSSLSLPVVLSLPLPLLLAQQQSLPVSVSFYYLVLGIPLLLAAKLRTDRQQGRTPQWGIRSPVPVDVLSAQQAMLEINASQNEHPQEPYNVFSELKSSFQKLLENHDFRYINRARFLRLLHFNWLTHPSMPPCDLIERDFNLFFARLVSPPERYAVYHTNSVSVKYWRPTYSSDESHGPMVINEYPLERTDSGQGESRIPEGSRLMSLIQDLPGSERLSVSIGDSITISLHRTDDGLFDMFEPFTGVYRGVTANSVLQRLESLCNRLGIYVITVFT